MIKFWSYTREYKKNNSKILSAINKTLKKGNLFFGDQQIKFEKNFSKKYKSKFAISCGSGTDALLICLLSLGIKEGDEVITAANTAIPTISAIKSAGATPKLVDIGEDYLINKDMIKNAITKKTKVIIPVHLYGQTCDMSEIIKICNRYKIKIVEDCAQAQGAMYKNKFAGTFGSFGCFSFYPTKVLGTYGDGGMILTNDKKLYLKAKRIRFYGIETSNKKNKFNNKYYANEHGINSRLDEIQSTILNIKLNSVDRNIKKRRLIAKKYIKALSNSSLLLPNEKKNKSHVYHLFTIYHPKGKKIMKLMFNKGIQTRSIYPYQINKMKAYLKDFKKSKNLNNSYKKSKGIFCLPLYPELKNSEINLILKTLKFSLKKLRIW